MSQIPTQNEPAAVQNSDQAPRVRQLVLLGQKRVQHGRGNDPLLRENTDVFGELLQKRRSTPVPVAKAEGDGNSEGLLHSIGLDDEASELKRKAFSLLVQLGFVESGKTHALRQRISHETRQAVADPASYQQSRQDAMVAESTSAKTEAGGGQAGENMGDNMYEELPEEQAAALEQKAAQAGDPVKQAAEAPDNANVEPAVAASLAAAESPVTAEKPRAMLLSDSSHVLRMPVNAETMRSVAIDLMAEKKAKELLTAEVKKSLLPVTGELSAVFESGKDGIAAIGYDRRGGTSYGKYQIASRVGSMKRFISYLEDKAPDYAERLRNAGPANTRSRWGGMPSEWKKIAAEDPEGFEKLQDEFILATNYQPALDGIKDRANLNVAELSPAVQEVLWSTAVQHGPGGASSIFRTAAIKADGKDGQDFDKALIEEVYRARKRNFSGSSRRIRSAVHARLNQEKLMALDLLEKDLQKQAML